MILGGVKDASHFTQYNFSLMAMFSSIMGFSNHEINFSVCQKAVYDQIFWFFFF